VNRLISEANLVSEAARKEMRESFGIRLRLFQNDIFFYPKPLTPLSLTGTRCRLECKHCASHYLEHMMDASSPKLLDLRARSLAAQGNRGILLSGGSTLQGGVPTYQFAKTIKSLKRDTGLKISAHTGLVDEEQAEILGGFLDMALVDVVGNNDTIQKILGIQATIKDYENTLANLSQAGISLAPHIIVGLHGGELRGEFKALKIALRYNPRIIVIVVFIPTRDTPLGDSPPPRIEDVMRIIASARKSFKGPISLSCVRPGGRYRSNLDEYAILCGVDRIAVPSLSAYKTCEKIGLKARTVDNMCCSY
jgi:uncharacterized radical SAM superfamily protein